MNNTLICDVSNLCQYTYLTVAIGIVYVKMLILKIKKAFPISVVPQTEIRCFEDNCKFSTLEAFKNPRGLTNVSQVELLS